MYRSCIFCSAELDSNEVIESFPVGGSIAFDAWKGRLWAVCPRCARWNLAPIEERWEPVEHAEKLFRDARLRVQSENVGLARLPDGTRLIRVGKALPGELAAWRYGRHLLQRRNRYFLGAAGAVAFVFGWQFLPLATVLGGSGTTTLFIYTAIQQHRQQKAVHRVITTADREIIVRRWHVPGMSILPGADDEFHVLIRDAHRKKPSWRGEVHRSSNDVATVTGAPARALLSRAMVQVNQKGASRVLLDDATRILAEAGTAESYLRGTAANGGGLGKRAGRQPNALARPYALALEMALNEESERRALEGELAGLEAAWREADEVAAIADALPNPIRLPRWLRA